MGAVPQYEVFAVRYAVHQRMRSDNFIARDPHDGPMPLDYFVWVIRGEGRTILVDTGFNEDAAQARQRRLLRCPIRALELLGIRGGEVEDVILTHLHYDHAGNIGLLPRARLHLQERELQYASGRMMRFDALRHPFSVDDVVNVVRGVYDKRVEFHDGNDELAPGIQLVLVGGHTQGLQAVRVHTQRGWVVLASDASHFYDNMRNQSPFPIVLHVGDMLEGYGRLLKLADSPEHFIPGHDPLVTACYPRWGDAGTDIVALHLPPVRPTRG